MRANYIITLRSIGVHKDQLNILALKQATLCVTALSNSGSPEYQLYR